MKVAARIYVMRSSEGWIKVGRSGQPEVRRGSLRNQGYGVLTVEFASEFYTEADKIEKTVHRLFKAQGKHIGRRHNQEKFSATVPEAIAAIEKVIADSGCVPTSAPPPKEATVTAKTYRLPRDLLDEMERVRKAMRIQPTETAVVETALWDFIKRENEEAKRSVRR